MKSSSYFAAPLLSFSVAVLCLVPLTAHAADLSITKAGPATTTVGSNVTFTLSGATNGTLGLPNGVVVTVTDTIPNDFTSIMVLSSPTWTCHVTGQVVTCTRSAAIPGNSAYPLITVGAVAHVAGNYQNCANISYVPIVTTPPDTNLANNHSCVNGVISAGVAHDVNITKTLTGTGPFPVGSSVQFTLHPGNSGPGSLSVGSGDVTVTDTVPAGFTYQGWSGNGWNCPSPAVNTVSPFTITCNYIGATVAGGNALIPINIAIKANAAGSFQNCSDIAYNHSPGDSWMGNNHSCVPFVVGTTSSWPMTAMVNTYNAGTPFGPQSVDIAVGGTVTFRNVDASSGWVINCVSAPVPCFAPLTLGAAPGNTRNTLPGTFPTPGTYVYHIVGYFINGTIIVH